MKIKTNKRCHSKVNPSNVCRPRPVLKGCPSLFPDRECNQPVIILDDVTLISCEGIISGKVLCDYVPQAGVVVQLSSVPPIVQFDNATPVTDGRGRFTTRVSIPPGTKIQQVYIRAEAVVQGVAIEDSICVRVECIACKNPLLTLIPPEGIVGCSGGKLRGRLTCDGIPVQGAVITIEIDAVGKIIASPNPVLTQPDGTFMSTLIPFKDIQETIMVTVSTYICGFKVTSDTVKIEVNCTDCRNPAIHLDDPGPISCVGEVTGKLTCDGVPVPNVEVQLSSTSFLLFNPPNPTTDANGNFSSTVTVPLGTPIEEGVPYTASATVNGIMVEETNFVRAGCVECEDPCIIFNSPICEVDCEGSLLDGRVICDGEFVPNAAVFITIESTNDNVFAFPNPAISDENGVFTTQIIPAQGVSELVRVSVSTTVGGEFIEVGPENVLVNCPFSDCSCQGLLCTDGNQEGAEVKVVQFGMEKVLEGNMEISLMQCGDAVMEECDATVDTFQFTFMAENMDSFVVTNGKRISFTCTDQSIQLEGLATGSLNNGPERTFQVTIDASLNLVEQTITWNIQADDGVSTTFETTVPFATDASSDSFIGDC